MRTVAANRVVSGWRKLAQDAQREPIRVAGDDSPDVVVMSSAQFDAIRADAKGRFFATVARMQEHAKAQGLTDDKLEILLADEN